ALRVASSCESEGSTISSRSILWRSRATAPSPCTRSSTSKYSTMALNWPVKVASSAVSMPISASSPICSTSFSVTMFHPSDVVYVILHGRFITIFTGKLFQYSPDPAPILHCLFAVYCQFLRDMTPCNLTQRDLPLPVMHLFMGRDRACGAHDTDIQIGHGEVRAMKGSDCLVTVSLGFQSCNVPGKVHFQRRRCEVTGVSAKQLVRSLTGEDTPVPVLTCPPRDKILGDRDAGVDRVFFRDRGDNSGERVSNLLGGYFYFGAGQAKQICCMPGLYKIMGP